MPVILHGAFDLWPPKQWFASAGEVTLCVAEPIVMHEKMTREELSAQVHAAMVKTLAELRARPRPQKQVDSYGPALAFLMAAAAVALPWWYWRN